MPAKKKKFIDKRNAVTFQLVHRSQHDPLQADDDAPQKVLLPTTLKADERKVEERKFGVFYEDGYDYLQHLRTVDQLYEVEPERLGTPSSSQNVMLQLPSKVFASTAETDVGLLNKAAPQSGPKLDWDPDIVAALDEDFDYDDPENLLEDDFVVAANDGEVVPLAPEELDNFDASDLMNIQRYKKRTHADSNDADDQDTDDYSDVDSEGVELSDDEQFSDVGSLGEKTFTDLETKTQFTNYSMSSSVIHRNEGLTLLDDRFEKLFEQYDETELGALDHEDISGCVPADSQILSAVVTEFEEQRKVTKMKDFIEKADDVKVADDSSDGEDDDLVRMVTREEPEEKWDCESILSTYSNIYNHPKTIEEVKPIRLSRKTDMPVDSLPVRGLTRKQLEELESDRVKEPPISYRPSTENAEERRERKRATKNEKKARREEKKANQNAFKEEKKRQEKEVLNLKQNLQGIKIG